jgi:ligand-binding SRPBCC domain-containing protein
MGFIHITNFIAAPSETVYDLSRHILLQKKAMDKIGVRQLRGVSSGLLSVNDTILWGLRIVNKDFLFSLKVTELNPGHFIQEDMTQGSLESFKHMRHFKKIQNGTLVIDEIFYSLPKKVWTPWIDRFFLNGKLHELLRERNKVLKEYAESNKWRALLTK